MELRSLKIGKWSDLSSWAHCNHKALKSRRTTQKRREKEPWLWKEPSEGCNIAVFEDRKETRAKGLGQSVEAGKIKNGFSPEVFIRDIIQWKPWVWSNARFLTYKTLKIINVCCVKPLSLLWLVRIIFLEEHWGTRENLNKFQTSCHFISLYMVYMFRYIRIFLYPQWLSTANKWNKIACSKCYLSNIFFIVGL